MLTNEQDDNLETPSASNDDNGQDSSPVADDKETSLTPEEQSAVAGTEEPSTEAGEEPSDDQDNSQTSEVEGTNEETKEPVPEVPPVVDKAGDDKLPFSRHERWKELVGEKNNYRQEIEQLKPAADQARALNDFMAQNQIQPAEFQAALKYLQALRTDPAAAYQMIKPTYEQLAVHAGERLPPELAAEVAAGTLSPERATQLARIEAQQRHQQWRQQQGQQGTQSAVGTLVQQTIGLSAQTKQQLDPDFKEGSPLWKQVDLNLRAMPTFQSPQEAQQGFEKAYNEAKGFLKQFQPRVKSPVSRRPPNSAAVGSNNRQLITSSDDVIKLMTANGGRAPRHISYK